MGLFSNKETEEKNEFGFIGASEWMKEQAKTAKAFNEEDDKMAGKDTPKQARLFIAIEDDEDGGNIAVSIKTNSPKTLIKALYKTATKDKTFGTFIKLTAAKLHLMDRLQNDEDITASSRDFLKELIETI